MRLKDKLDALGVDLQLTRPKQPRVIDDDDGSITVEHPPGIELRAWTYDNEDERRKKMLCAREYVEGWCDAVDTLFAGLDKLINPGAPEN